MKSRNRKSDGEEMETFDRMLTSLVELLEEKGLVTQEEWERRIAERLKEEVGLVRV